MRQPIEIPRVEGLSDGEFRDRYLKANRPVVIAGGAADWPAAGWTPEVLRAKAGAAKVLTHRSGTVYFGLDEENGGPKFPEEEMTLDRFVSLALDPPEDGMRYYLQRASIPDRIPGLLDDLKMPAGLDPKKIYLLNLWFGPAANVTRLHYDVPNNFLVHFYGRKRLTMFAPGDTKRIYPFRSKAYNMSQVDIDLPDVERFPKFADAQPYQAEIGPGDMIYIPPFWWHQVYSLEMGISANYWWIPSVTQLFAPQLPDTFMDITRALVQRVVHRPAAPGMAAG
jgi:hypothetical protein